MDTPAPRPESFDVAINRRFNEVAVAALADYGELEAVACIYTWKGNLNDTEVTGAMWRGPQGAVGDPTVVVNSLRQLLRLAGMQFHRLEGILSNYQAAMTPQPGGSGGTEEKG